ncbi:hypothetical protein CAEBREN_30857 [Caenorhabditis brenneri]|uniref:Uncharacterized protein n=1 Tax=Caenorhabditis brenneri TaxID=135651 RepID=G0P6F0_CAEBE|nr:hypothetical protein CAEBREN_30857 [Caenorhabditis brenneri]
MDEIILKLVLMLLMFTLTVLVGLSPLKVLHKLRHEAATAQSSSKHKHVSLVLCLLTCFSGGVFLATCFLHLFPELRENLESLEMELDMKFKYPVGELLSCLGFFLIFFLEEVVIMIIPSFAHGHGHGGHGHAHEHIHEATPPIATKSVEATGSGCCMSDITDVVKSKELGTVGMFFITFIKLICNRTTYSHKGLYEFWFADETTALTTSTTKRAILEEKESEGHCQTHCPLTVHERRGSNECTANSTQDGHHVSRRTQKRFLSYGSMYDGEVTGNEDDVKSEWYHKIVPLRNFVLTKFSSVCLGDFITVFRTFAPIAFAEPERCETNCDAVDEDPPILMKSRPHAHSHGVRSITFVLALGIHSIIEGLAFGVQTGNETIVALFLSLMVHKLIVAFSVGLQLFRTHAHQIKWVIISIFTLASMTPLGAIIGVVVSSAAENTLWKAVTVTILQGLAVGTFIYVTFFEVLLHERDNEHPNLLKLLVMFIGFALIGGLRVFESEHGHSHTNGTLHDHGH